MGKDFTSSITRIKWIWLLVQAASFVRSEGWVRAVILGPSDAGPGRAPELLMDGNDLPAPI